MARKKPRKKSQVTLDTMLAAYTKGQPGRAAVVIILGKQLQACLKQVAKLGGASFNTTINILLATTVESARKSHREL